MRQQETITVKTHDCSSGSQTKTYVPSRSSTFSFLTSWPSCWAPLGSTLSPSTFSRSWAAHSAGQTKQTQPEKHFLVSLMFYLLRGQVGIRIHRVCRWMNEVKQLKFRKTQRLEELREDLPIWSALLDSVISEILTPNSSCTRENSSGNKIHIVVVFFKYKIQNRLHHKKGH